MKSDNGVKLSDALLDTQVPLLTRESAPNTTSPLYATATTFVPVWGGTCRFQPQPASIYGLSTLSDQYEQITRSAL